MEILQVYSRTENTKSDDKNIINYGENLTARRKEQIKKPITTYDDIFASNPKKSNQTSLVTDDIPYRGKFRRGKVSSGKIFVA